MSNPDQLFLLADHIKLSLLERQRAKDLGLEDDSQDGNVSRSIEQFAEGIRSLENQKASLEQSGDADASSSLAQSISELQKQLDALAVQFNGESSPSAEDTVKQPNSAALASDFEHAESRRSKTVRFNDTPQSPSEELFGRYRDDPANETAGYRDEAEQMSNQQIHQYHSDVMLQQDEQLDRLGESIGRQRELSMQIGDELDSHVAMLDEVDGVVDRHQSRLDRAKRTLGKVARGASENKQMTTIVVLIIILVLLIAILK